VLVVSSFSGLFPVVSGVLMDKSLIINGIHFSGMVAFSGSGIVFEHDYRI
jgi:hypothetical protein